MNAKIKVWQELAHFSELADTIRWLAEFSKLPSFSDRETKS